MWSNKFSSDRNSNSYDMFMRGEEILSGAQRIHNPQVCILAIFGYLKADRISSIWHFLLVPDWEGKVARCGSWHHCLLHRFIQVKNMMFDISESRTFLCDMYNNTIWPDMGVLLMLVVESVWREFACSTWGLTTSGRPPCSQGKTSADPLWLLFISTWHYFSGTPNDWHLELLHFATIPLPSSRNFDLFPFCVT